MWRVCYPIGIHFGISELLAVFAMNLILHFTTGGTEGYYQNVIMLTGMAGIVTFIPAWFLYQRDRLRREQCGVVERGDHSFFAGEIILLLLLGAALALYGNLLIGMLDFVVDPSEYSDLMKKLEEGQSLFSLILWMGIVAPVAEESIFRWLIFLRLRDYCKRAWVAALISGVMFGLYHGNVAQSVYASILGFVFAMVVEWTGNIWSSAFLHIGANVASVVLSKVVAKWSETRIAATMVYLLVALLAVLVYGVRYFVRMSGDHSGRGE